MKNFILKITLPLLITGAAILSIGTNCAPNSQVVVTAATCDTLSTKFMTLYNAHTPINNYGMDLQVAEYTFKSSVAGSICAVGYLGNPNLTTGNYYKIEIIDVINSTVLSTGVYNFGSTVRNYKSLLAPVSITANSPYIMRRTVVNNLGIILNTNTNYKNVGPILPLTNGNLTITSTKAYDFYTNTAVNVNNNGILPCIDFALN